MSIFVAGATEEVLKKLGEKMPQKKVMAYDHKEYTANGGVCVFVEKEGTRASIEYDVRLKSAKNESDDTTAERIKAALSQSKWFRSTRGNGGDNTDFLKAVRSGLAQDGGLFLPESIPSFSADDFKLLSGQSYRECAQYVLESFNATSSLKPSRLRELISRSYSTERWDDDDICVIKTPSGEDPTIHVMELWHGPTAAFKDFALQLFPKFFSESIAGEGSQYVILAATSGDTGVAAISGFMQEEGIAVLVLYPKDGVSEVQRQQMLSCDGGNVRVLGVDADFDFCQSTVKKIFTDTDFKSSLHADHNATLSSANSINWGRLLPQIVYYIYSYGHLISLGQVDPHSETPEKREFDVVVPTGNFGNILSAYYAKLAGLPIRKLVCASNVNNVLTDFIDKGVYDIRDKGLQQTSSPSIDILKSSNVERLLFLLSGGDAEEVSRMMKLLDTEGHFTVSPGILAELKKSFSSGFCTEKECLSTIKTVQETNNYLLDTHTAVAYKVMKDYINTRESAVPIVLASTASFAKFPDAVQEGLQGKESATLQPYDVIATYDALKESTSASVPRALARIFQSGKTTPPPRTCEKSHDAILKELTGFCAELKAGK
eukprot:TRINITY_DN9345_c0_g1_i1.p1 TRINITY_DN9345_c0_g1~~TRINITY_DN9345_c0_g1_i1.p1  ORF type:complete len:603 (+),score=119.50 TRINITY_DN9345_c0_g1_i1:134-1942(+)